MGGNDHTLVLSNGVINSGQQVCKRFADAGAGFDKQVMLIVDRILHGSGHLKLLRAMFVLRAQSPSDGTFGAEDVLEKFGQAADILADNESKV